MSESKKDAVPKDKKQQDKSKQKKGEVVQQLTEEEEKKKQDLELLVQKIMDPKPSVQKQALETLRSELRSTDSSVTAVPKPLKFLGPFYEPLKEFFAKPESSENRVLLADIISVLAMVMSKEGTRDCLKFKLQGSLELSEWGHEYLRYLAGEIGQEYQIRYDLNPENFAENDVADLVKLADQIVPYFIKSNAESDAIDLLLEVEKLQKIVPFCDKNNYSRVVLYLISTAKFFLDPENVEILRIAHQILIQVEKYPEALRVSIALNDFKLIEDTFHTCKDMYDILNSYLPLHSAVQKQLAFMLARHRIKLNLMPDMETDDDSETEKAAELMAIMGNTKLSGFYQYLAKELDALEPKLPEDIYKSHLAETRSTLTQNIDSARQNLASTFVNAFVNAGFGKDKLVCDENVKWLYKNKDHGMMSAAASLGMLYQWNTDEGLAEVDKYLYAGESYIKGGALLAIGLVHSGVNDVDSAFALLSEYVENPSRDLRIGAILGLGIAYAGTRSENVKELLLPIAADSDQPIDVVSFASLALGLIFVGTCNEDISSTIVSVLLERNDEKTLANPLIRFLCLALGLLFLNKQEQAEAVVETTKTLNEKISKYAQLVVETCAHAGTGNVLKIQEWLKICGEHLEEGKDNKHQAMAVLGIALTAMGEGIGADMTLRSLDHILQYGDPVVKRAVPLAIGLLNISNPNVAIMDTLSKLSHDSDAEIADGGILALGLIGAGTNNARISQLLRQLSSYYAKDANHLFMVKIAQGILFMGKGLLTISPFYSDRLIMSPCAIAGIMTVLHACLDMKNTIFSQYHYLLYFFSSAMHPRMMVTVDSDLNPINVSVRVGTAVDIVAQAGRPKTITGFQTHNTPVLLQYEDRAELGSEEYLPMTSVLEDVVLLKKNPDFTA